MKVIATKWEDIEVDISVEQLEVLMCELLKEDYKVMLDMDDKIQDAIKIVYEAYSGKPIDLMERH